MTKRRDPITFHRALTTIAALIGWDRCAAICGCGERAVRNWSDPDTDTEIRLIDARRLDQAFLEAGGDHAPFHRVYALQLDLDTSADQAAIALTAVAGAVAREGGEAVNALLEAAAPGAGPRARHQARRETREAIETLSRGLAVLGEDDT